jgi:DNA-binding MarR family transcriptional regulator
MEDNIESSKLTYQFIKVPKGVLPLKDLSPTSKLVLGVLISYSSNQPFANPGNAHLSRLLNCTASTISKSIAELRKADLIKILNPQSNKRKLYVDKHRLDLLDKSHRSKRNHVDAWFPALSTFQEALNNILSDIYTEKNFKLEELLSAIARKAETFDPFLEAILKEKGVEAFILTILETIFKEDDIRVIPNNLLQFHKNNSTYQGLVPELYKAIQLLYGS